MHGVGSEGEASRLPKPEGTTPHDHSPFEGT